MLNEQVADSDYYGCGTHPAFYSAVFNAVTKDLSGKEGCLVEGVFLHVMPVLLLTEYQSERFFWAELRKMISAEVYLNDIKLNLNLHLIKPYPNRMYVALTENRNTSGVYLPVQASGKYNLRVEWRICFNCEGKQDEYITHTQKIVIASPNTNHAALTVYSVPEASYDDNYSMHSPMSLKTHACSELVVTKPRAEVFDTNTVRKDNHLAISETVTIHRVLDLKRAAFFTPLLHRLKSDY